MNKELEEAANKASLRIYAYESEPRINRDAKIGFIDGAEWQKEQSANDAIELLNWLRDDETDYFLLTNWIQTKKSSQEVYELWLQTK